MKKINIIERYHSLAMRRMTEPLMEGLQEIAEVTWADGFDPEADLNYHMPWHFILNDEIEWKKTKNAIMYTHVQEDKKEGLAEACYRADVVFAMSHKGKSELIELGVPSEKIWVAYCGANHVIGRQRNIGIVATIQPDGRKRSHILLDLIWKMDKKYLPITRFVLLGHGWEDMSQKMANAGANVAWEKELLHEDLVQTYQNFDILISPGYMEGGPLPLIEALKCGVPVLSEKVGFAHDFLDDKYLFSTVEELVEKVEARFAERLDILEIGNMMTWNKYAIDHSLVLGRLIDAEFVPSFHLATGRYAQIMDVIEEIKPSIICEIGTWNGHRATQMIQTAQRHNKEIVYHGFDLFEEMDQYNMVSEMSKWPPRKSTVEQYLKPTGADIRLHKGNTRETLKMHTPCADFYYIDGGHSEETIASDWDYVSQALPDHGVAIFDDYYDEGPEGMGCNRLVDGLNPDEWQVTILPHKTEAQYKDEGLNIRMVKVTHA
ncbi:MAG: class I SAM-dependent methyltransferase [Planctomycetota bacterium]|jgi:hypothetical protein